MRVTYHVSFYVRDGEWVRARKLFTALGRGDLARGPPERYGHDLSFEDDAAYERFLDTARVHGFSSQSFGMRREAQYSARELLSAPLLYMVSRAAHPVDGGPAPGMKYDLSEACRLCGTGARQLSGLLVRSTQLPRVAVTETKDGEWLVDHTLATELRASLRGIELRAVADRETGDATGWTQLVPQTEFPPFGPGTEGFVRERPCELCGRDGYFNDPRTPPQIHYLPGACEGVPDVVATYERFGNGGLRPELADCHFAAPLTLISPRLFRRLRMRRIRGLKFHPVVCEPQA